MTSILSDIAGFGRSGLVLERAVTRERMPVLAASFDASAALSLGTSYLLSGGVGGSLGQDIRALSLTTPRLTLGSPLRFGSLQTGSLSRGLWSGGMPLFPLVGGMWPGVMGAGGMFGAPVGSYAGGHEGGSPGDTTPRRLMAQVRNATSAAAAASDNATKSDATPAAKSGTTATAAAPAGAGKTAAAEKTTPTLAEKAEQRWKRAAERVVKAVQKNKGLKDAIGVAVNVVGRQMTVTPKPGAKPSEKQLTAFVIALTKLVNGKGPLGGSTLMVGGKKYNGKIAVAELVKTLMPEASVVVGTTPPKVAPAGLVPQFKNATALKAFATLVANHAKWKNSLAIEVNTSDATMTITLKPGSTMSKQDAQAFVKFLNQQRALRGVSVRIGNLDVGIVPMFHDDAADMVNQLSKVP